jgi:hypothetical protein
MSDAPTKHARFGPPGSATPSCPLAIGTGSNARYVDFEVAAGSITGWLPLLPDAGYTLRDALGLVLSTNLNR